MRNEKIIHVVIPALNEEASLPRVLEAMPDWVDAVYIGDNGSTDNTAKVAVEGGAIVVPAPQRGYGSACLAALNAIAERTTTAGCDGRDGEQREAHRPTSAVQSTVDTERDLDSNTTTHHCPDIIVFLDADFSDHPEQMDRLVDPILGGDAELVIGSRVMGNRERGALTPQQRFGNALACTLMRWFWKVKHTDLGPFRAIRYDALQRLDMDDPNFGWTVQMQVRAAKRGIKAIDVPVDYRKRIGKSKISGTIRGVFAAGTKILGVIFSEAMRRRD